MRRRILCLLLLSLLGAPRAFCADADAGPPDPVGIWRGELEREGDAAGEPLRVVLRVSKGAQGLTATLDGLGATLRDLKVENLTVIEDVLSFQVSAVQGRFAGNFSPVGDSLRGTWSQGEESRQLIFFRD